MKKILILGASGFIGRNLLGHLGDAVAVGTFDSTSFKRGIPFDPLRMRIADLDIDGNSFSHAVLLYAMTNPDACAREPEVSHRLNVESTVSVIEELNHLGIKTLFASTEAVFDGRKGNYRETDTPNPFLTYGKQKFAIEKYLAAAEYDSVVMRIAKVYGSHSKHECVMAGWLGQLLEDIPILRCASDFISSPVHVNDLSRVIAALIKNDCSGIYHVAGPEALSRFEMCQTLLNQLHRERSISTRLEAVSIDDFPTLEGRPKNVSMSTDKIKRDTGLEFRNLQSWCEELVNQALEEGADHSTA